MILNARFLRSSLISGRDYEQRPNFTFLAISSTASEASLPTGSSIDDDRTSDVESSDDDAHPKAELDNSGKPLRTFRLEDATNPSLQLTLVKTKEKIGRARMGYLVVSYCWPSKEDRTEHLRTLNLPVIINEVDGSRRPSRAAPHIIRRAVKHAADLRLKYIWLDQECINQSNPDDKQTAIQFMDLVYRRTSNVLRLLNVHFTSQEPVDLLHALHYHN